MNEKSPITTHILDLGAGRPASGVPVTLEVERQGDWQVLAQGETDSDGRLMQWFTDQLESGLYRLRFNTAVYFQAQEKDCFYPQVTIDFAVTAVDEHYHVPLLLNQWGYSTYRGS